MCSCGCNTCETKIRGPLLTENKVKSLLSEGLQFHIDKKIPLFKTVYRIGSDEHLALIKEARKMYSRNIIDLCEDDKGLIETNIGEFAIYEGEIVPLDLPMLNEEELTSKEQKIVDDILQGLNENVASSILNKMRKYASKGLLTLAMVSAITSGLQAQNIPQSDVDLISQNGIELVQQKDIIDSKSESLLKDSLSKRQFKELKKQAEGMGAYITAVRGTNRNALASQANMQAKVHTKQGTIKVKDTKTFSVGGKYLYIIFYTANSLNEAEYKGKDVKLNKPKRGGSKAYYVYVNSGKKTKDGKIKVKKVSFGSGGLRAKIKDKDARNAFAKRHNCKDKKDRTKAGYWSCNLPRYAKALGLGSNMNTYW